MNATLKTTLKELGFNDKEIVVYVALLKNGKLTPAAIAKQTKINRATVYNIAKSLQTKGVVAEDVSGKASTFVALPIQSLEQLVERPMRELEEKRPLVDRAIRELGMLRSEAQYPVPKIRFVQEADVENFLYENMAGWIENMQSVDSAWWGIQDSTWIDQFAQFGDWYWKQPIHKTIAMNLIGNESEAERKALKKFIEPKRDVRFFNDMIFTSSIWVGGDYLIMMITRQHPLYLVEIHDATLAHNMREVFKKLWAELGSNKK